MSDPDRLAATPTIERMVRIVDPTWTVRADVPVSTGQHYTHRLRVGTRSGEQSVVLKAFPDRGPVCREARLLTILGETTDLPVATVHGVVDAHDDLPTPYFLMEALPGETIHRSTTGALSRETLRQIAVSSGRQLATLHTLDAVDSFRVATVDRGEPLHGNRPPGDVGALHVPDGEESWPSHVDSSFAKLLDALATSRFGDVRSDVEALVDPVVAALRGDAPFHPVVGRVEHSLDNILVDSESGSVTGLLDWEFVAAMTAANDLVFAEFWLSGGLWGLLPFTPDYRNLVRQGLREGYVSLGPAGPLNEHRKHREGYEMALLLRTMVHFEGLVDAYGPTAWERTDAAVALRERLARLVENCHS